MKSYLAITIKYLKVQKKRSILAITGIILSVALITGVGSLILSFQHSMLVDTIRGNGSYHALIENVDSINATKIKYHLNVNESAIIKENGFAVFSKTNGSNDQPPARYYSIMELSKGAADMLPIILGEGRFPTSPGEIAVDYWTIQYFNKDLKIGDVIELDVGKRFDKNNKEIKESGNYTKSEVFVSNGLTKYTVVGFLKPAYIIDRYFAQAITYLDDTKLDKDQRYNALIKVKSEKNVQKQVKAVASDLGINLSGDNSSRIVFNEKVLRLMGQSTNNTLNQTFNYTFVVLVLLIIISTIAVIYNTFNISVVERISQFGLIRCVGSTPSQILKMVLTEAVILGTIGIPIGVAVGTVAMGFVFKIIKIIAPGVEFATLELIISPFVIIISILLGYITVFLSALLPAISAAKVSPMDALRNNKSYKKEKIKKTKLLAFYKLLGVEGWVAVKNLNRNRKRFYITVFSMVISIVLFIVFGSFMRFYSDSGVSDRAENPSYSLSSIIHRNPAKLSEEDYTKLKSIKGVQNIFKYGSANVSVSIPEKKMNTRVFSIMNSTMQTDGKGNAIIGNSNIICYGDKTLDVLQSYMKSGKITAEDFENGKSVLAVTSSQVYDKKNKRSVILDAASLQAGDEVTVKLNENEKKIEAKELKISGILEYGILGQQRNINGGIYIIVSEKLFNELTQDSSYPDSLMIQMFQNADTGEMKAFLDDFIARNPDFQYFDYAQLGKDFKAQWMVICIFVYGFTAVISLIGCLNIINSISTNIILRTRELSVLRAIGMTGNGIRRLVCMESIVYGITAAIIGAIAGSLISKLLYNSIRTVRDFNWTLPFNLILIGFAATIFISIVAGFVPLKRINNNVIIEGIRAEE